MKLAYKLFRKIYQIKPVSGTSHRRIQPPVEVLAQHLFGHVANIQKNILPLAPLCFVAGDCIGILYLNDIVMGVLLHFLHLAGLGGDVLVIFQYGVKELVVQLLW